MSHRRSAQEKGNRPHPAITVITQNIPGHNFVDYNIRSVLRQSLQQETENAEDLQQQIIKQ